jgi:hypothetical protein
MESLWFRGGIAPTLDLGTRWGLVFSVTPRPRVYTRVKDPRYPLYRRLVGPQSRSGHRG